MRNLDYVSAGILSNRVCKDTLKLMFRVSLDIVKRRLMLSNWENTQV